MPWEKNLTDLKILSCVVTNCNHASKMSPCIVTNCNVGGDKMSSCMVQKLHHNNNNLNNNNITTTNRKKSAVVGVNFKKLKEERKWEDVENLDLSDPLWKVRKSYRIIELIHLSLFVSNLKVNILYILHLF